MRGDEHGEQRAEIGVALIREREPQVGADGVLVAAAVAAAVDVAGAT